MSPAGYSGTPLPKKLGMKAGQSVALVDAKDGVRDQVLGRGLVDVKVCAIDEDWSGLKLVVRKELR